MDTDFWLSYNSNHDKSTTYKNECVVRKHKSIKEFIFNVPYMCLNKTFGWSYLVMVCIFEQKLNFLLSAHSAIFIFAVIFHKCVVGEDVLQS